MMGYDDKSLENGLEGAQEVQEGVSGSVSGGERGLSSEGVGEDSNGPMGQNTEESEQKKSKKWLVILLILAGVIVIGVVSAVLVMRPGEDDRGTSVIEDEREDESDIGGKLEPELEELDTNSELVQRLYGQITGGIDDRFRTSTWMRMLKGEDTDELAVMIGFLNTDDRLCVKTGRNFEFNGELFPGLDEFCRSGVDVREKVQEIFGKNVELQDGMQIGQYFYDKDTDEFWRYFFYEEGMVHNVKYELYRAEGDGSRIYIYELVAKAQDCPVDAEQFGDDYCLYPETEMVNGKETGISYSDEREVRFYHIDTEAYDESWSEIRGRRLPNDEWCYEAMKNTKEGKWLGERIPEMTVNIKHSYAGMVKFWTYEGEAFGLFDDMEGLEHNSIKLADYADLVDQFRWTFVRNSEGNYIFEKLEKVK